MKVYELGLVYSGFSYGAGHTSCLSCGTWLFDKFARTMYRCQAGINGPRGIFHTQWKLRNHKNTLAGGSFRVNKFNALEIVMVSMLL